MNRKTVIVTGSSDGIGYAIAKHFIENGDNVILNSSNYENLKAAFKRLGNPENARFVAGDVGDKSTGLQLVESAMSSFGSIDVLINNAGIFQPKPFLEVEPSDIERFLNTNLKGTYYTTQAAIQEMVKKKDGVIINIGTVLVDHAIAGFPATASVISKGGIHALTKQLAAEFGKDNIRVNTLSLGTIRSPLQAKIGIEDSDSLAGLHLLNRIGEPQEVAEAAFYLAYARFVTGETINLAGGHTVGHAI